MRTYDDITLISGTAHPELAKAIAAEVGRDLAKAHVARFPDGEVDIKIDIQRIASNRNESHRVASNRTESHRIAPNFIQNPSWDPK